MRSDGETGIPRLQKRMDIRQTEYSMAEKDQFDLFCCTALEIKGYVESGQLVGIVAVFRDELLQRQQQRHVEQQQRVEHQLLGAPRTVETLGSLQWNIFLK